MKIRLCLLLILIPARVLAWQSAGDFSLPENPIQGLRLLEAKGCVECHSMGDGGSHIGPNLAGGLFDGSFLDLGAALWNHVPGMSVTFEVTQREWPSLTEEEVKGLLSFLYFIDYLGQPGNPEAGEGVFRGNSGCSACHVIGGGDRTAGPDLAHLSRFASPLYVAQEIWNHGPVMLASMSRLGLSPPTFGETDLRDLSAFLRREAGPGLQGRLLAAPGNPRSGLPATPAPFRVM